MSIGLFGKYCSVKMNNKFIFSVKLKNQRWLEFTYSNIQNFNFNNKYDYD